MHKKLKPDEIEIERYDEEEIAKVAYEILRTYLKLLGEPAGRTWEKATIGIKLIVICRVQEAMAQGPKYAPNLKKIHDVYWKEKKLEGWKYGDVVNKKEKRHPAAAPWSELTLIQKLKYDLFYTILTRLTQCVTKKKKIGKNT